MKPLIWTRWRPGRYTCGAHGYLIERDAKVPRAWNIRINDQPRGFSVSLAGAKAFCQADYNAKR